MSDILDRLHAYSTRWHPEDAVDLVDEAADEIERLRGTVMGQEVKIHKLSDEVARLRGIIHAMSNSPNAILEGQ